MTMEDFMGIFSKIVMYLPWECFEFSIKCMVLHTPLPLFHVHSVLFILPDQLQPLTDHSGFQHSQHCAH